MSQTLPGKKLEAPRLPSFVEPQSLFSSNAKKPDKISFMASDDFPPFAFRDSSGRLVGYNVDLARAICEALEIPCSLTVKQFSQMIPALESKEGDAVIAGVSITPDTLQKVAFSEVYMRFPARFVMAKDKAIAPLPNTLEGKTVAVEAGSSYEAYIERFFPLTILKAFPTTERARQALVRGDADAHFGDSMRLSFWLESEASANCCRFAGDAWLDPDYFGQGMAIAVRKEDEVLLSSINLALARLQEDGRLDELYLRYFPRSFF
ncbi:transporter substrate-binding domain-containing protein [Pseudovibrio sp. SPO723]|uniref:transporter substrate-binding domain-containing protein n=1 Tax=Nesiotobacter zosterae TaxID=392721 RepID=UPI0029C20F4D|nr:transporter substrate-binding domain-containing protein [Pseudovibrio sp. SPO723]MDX5593155.1 transporter substrate-binding domain-containing protein [Pseudovibrio sp. SPO723]